jgi:hypothetical protein
MLDRLAGKLAGVPGVRAVLSPANTPDSLLVVRESGGVILVVGIDTRDVPTDSIVPGLRTVLRAELAQLRVVAPEATLRLKELAGGFGAERAASNRACLRRAHEEPHHRRVRA